MKTGLTLTAFAFDALENNGESDGAIYNNVPGIFNNNLYAVAAIGSYDPVSFQLWYASLIDSVNLIIGDVNFSLNITDDVNIGAQVQYAHADIDKVHDKEKGFVSLEDQGSFIDVGEIKSALDYTALEGKANFWFLKAGYTFADKFRVGGDYSNGKVKLASGDKEKYQEYVARLTYDYSAKLQFSSFYAYEINKHQDDSKDKTKQLRFQAKYTF